MVNVCDMLPQAFVAFTTNVFMPGLKDVFKVAFPLFNVIGPTITAFCVMLNWFAFAILEAKNEIAASGVFTVVPVALGVTNESTGGTQLS